MKSVRTCLFGAWIAAASVCGLVSAAFGDAPDLVPLPVRVDERPGRFVLTGDATITAGSGAAREAELLAARFRAATGFELPVRVRRSGRGRLAGARLGRTIRPSHSATVRGAIDLSLDPSLRDLGPEGYVLHVDTDGVRIRSASRAGLFYGTQTLGQLFPAEIFRGERSEGIPWSAPAIEIVDWPRFPWRGAHLDVSRHFFSVADVKRYIDQIAAHKMNRFHWHLTDDQGWRVEIERYPRLTEIGSCRQETQQPFLWDIGILNWTGLLQLLREGGTRPRDGTPYCGFYTQNDVRDIVAYARDRHIVVVPEIDLPGHSRAAIASYPELGNTSAPVEVATDWGIFEDILNVDESTIRFYENVLRDVLTLFPGPYVHIGGDEVATAQWEASPQAQARVVELGLNDVHELAGYFVGRMAAFLLGRGRRPVGWNEILESDLDEDVIVMSWTGVGPGIEAARRGLDVVMTPTSATYFDYAASLTPEQEKQIEEFAGGPIPVHAFLNPLTDVYGFDPVPAELSEVESRRILGTQGQLWTEYIRNRAELDRRAWPRLAALAEVAWTPQALRSYEDFVSRLEPHRARLEAMGIELLPLEDAAFR